VARVPAIDPAPETLRAFLAVEIPEALRERCAAIGERLGREVTGVSWVKAANLHVTLKFLGNARPAQIARLAESLAHKAARIEPFDVELAGIGCFPSPRRARVIWIGVGDGTEPLRRLAEKAEGAGEKAGFARESRPFSGHLTLGRVRMPRGPARRAGRENLRGGPARRAGRENLRGGPARGAGRENLRGGPARRAGRENLRGGPARRAGRENLRGGPARRAGRENLRGGPARGADRQTSDHEAGSGGGDLSGLVAREDPGVLGRFRVSEVVLMQSRLHPDGAIHTPLHRIPLGREAIR